MRSKSDARKVVKCIIILLSPSSVKWPWWRWKKPFGYFMTATLLVLSLTDCLIPFYHISFFFSVFKYYCLQLWIIRVKVNIKISFFSWQEIFLPTFVSYIDMSEDIPSLKIKAIRLTDHSVFAFKDLLIMMISLSAKKLLSCYFWNCF